jgi:hypothetical protein
MRNLLLKSLLVAVLIGPTTTFVFTVAYWRSAVRYEPGISEVEMKSYDNRTVSDFEAFLKSREVKLTRYQSLRESMGSAYFWEGIARGSLRSGIAVFFGCVIIGTWDRRRGFGQPAANPR